jgi:hypothetical protein
MEDYSRMGVCSEEMEDYTRMGVGCTQTLELTSYYYDKFVVTLNLFRTFCFRRFYIGLVFVLSSCESGFDENYSDCLQSSPTACNFRSSQPILLQFHLLQSQ